MSLVHIAVHTAALQSKWQHELNQADYSGHGRQVGRVSCVRQCYIATVLRALDLSVQYGHTLTLIQQKGSAVEKRLPLSL